MFGYWITPSKNKMVCSKLQYGNAKNIMIIFVVVEWLLFRYARMSNTCSPNVCIPLHLEGLGIRFQLTSHSLFDLLMWHVHLYCVTGVVLMQSYFDHDCINVPVSCSLV